MSVVPPVLDIVNLIETNPLTRFHRIYQDRFIQRIQTTFTETQQRLFVASFYCYLNYKDEEFVIDLDNIWKWIGFSRKDNCKAVLEKHFTKDIDYKVFYPKMNEIIASEVKNITPEPAGAKKSNDTRGGYNKELVMLTIPTFKELCLVSNTSKARELRQYYILLEKLNHQTMDEQVSDMRLQFEVQVKTLQIQMKTIHHLQREKHNILLNEYDKQNVVYFCKIKDSDTTTEDESFFMKVGSTQNIKQRVSHIEKDFGVVEPELLDIISTDNHTKLENIIHNCEIVKPYKCSNFTKKDGTISREIYLVNKEIYSDILRTAREIRNNASRPTTSGEESIRIEELRLQCEKEKTDRERIGLEKIKLELELLKLKIQQSNTTELTNEIVEDNTNDELSVIDEKDTEEEQVQQQTPTYIKKRNNGVRVPKVYQYSPDNLKTPIRIFDSPTEAEREMLLSPSAVKRAYQNNTIYKDFRWFYCNRNETLPEEIPQTIESKSKSTEIRHIAMIDIKQTKVLAVYGSQKEAVEARNMKCNSFTRAIQQNSISSGHYWKFFSDCSEEMKAEYFRNNVLPQKLTSAVGLKIQQINPINKAVIETFSSKRDVVKKFQVSYAKLNKIVNTPEIYDGFLWNTM